MATNNSDPAPSPIAIGIVRKITVHLILLKNAEKKTGSAKMVRKLSRPTKDGAVAPSQSQKAIAIVSSPGIRMIAALIMSAGSKNGTAELVKRNFTTETQRTGRLGIRGILRYFWCERAWTKFAFLLSANM